MMQDQELKHCYQLFIRPQLNVLTQFGLNIQVLLQLLSVYLVKQMQANVGQNSEQKRRRRVRRILFVIYLVTLEINVKKF